MNSFEWSAEYSVAHDTMDNHHQWLFDILNDINCGLKENVSQDRIFTYMQELREYTNFHFSEEEKLMAEIGYPDLDAHKALHQGFIQQIQAYMNEFQTVECGETKCGIAEKIRVMGTDWLKNHICVADKRYGEYLKNLK